MSNSNRKLKVLLVSPYSEKQVGGIINWTKYIVNYQREHNDEIELCLLNNDNATQVLGSANIFKRLATGLSNYMPILREFKEKVANERFDVAHICTSGSFGLIRDLILVNTGKKKGVKTVVHTHFGRIPQILNSRGWEAVLLKRLLKCVDCVAVMDSFSLKALHEGGYKNVRFVPNPLSLDVQNIVENLGDTEREPRKIVFAGHVLPTKGLIELVKACREIPNIKLLILGNISDVSFREQLYDIGGNDSKRWLSIPGNKPFREVIKEMRSCGIFVLPSYSEGFPNVILESMACGCPIVATSVGAIPEMLNVEGENPCGVCVLKQNVDELRNAIEDLLDNSGKAAVLGRNAKERVYEQYSMPKVWNQLFDIWKGVTI